MNLDLTKFDGLALSLFLIAGVEGTDFPDITDEYIDGFVDWITDPANVKWLKEMRKNWEEKSPPKPEPIEPDEPPGQRDMIISDYYHHTQLRGPDGGVSLVLCKGDDRIFDSVTCGGVNIPLHGNKDKGRTSYWNKRKTPEGYPDIVAILDGKEYRFPTGNPMSYGKCKK